MAFIIIKKINGKEYFYLNENKRVDGKVKTKTLCYLGKDKKEALKKAEEVIQKMKGNNFFKENKNANSNELIHQEITVDELANFCKSKGFIFRSSDIYGGISGFWDYGPIGVELFNNLKSNWWKYFVHDKENMTGIDASIISHPKTWEASGHISGFNDLAVKCKKCKKNAKIEAKEYGKVKCECGGEYEKIGEFNLLFKTSVGALDKEDAYLRGETAQGMFLDFKLVSQTSRMQLPFGIAQIGKCFRNEIAPRDFLFRSREFHIAEFEFFIHPKEEKCEILSDRNLNLNLKFLDSETQKKGSNELKTTTIKKMIHEKRLDEWHAYWLSEQILWLNSLGLKDFYVREHMDDERSFYSSATFDIDYSYSFGSKEIAGNSNRGQYDLTQQEKYSKQSLSIYDDKTQEKVLPRVIEPTFGMERVFLAILTNAYSKNSKGEVVLKIPSRIAPIKAAIFPIIKRDDFEKLSEDIVYDLKKEFNVVYDRSGSIGRRYARNDEIGTPFCITIDEKSLKNKDVTIRDRDTTKQIRVKISNLREILRKLIYEEIEFVKAGKLVLSKE